MPDPIPSKQPGGLFDYQFHQVALFCPDNGADDAMQHWESLGYDQWIVDSAVLVGWYWDPMKDQFVESETEARMLFNYDIMPMELEFLEYHGNDHRWAHMQGRSESPFISHMSVYVDDVVAETKNLQERLGYGPFHRFITTQHSNPAVKGHKRFIESIFATGPILGYDTKLIQKVPWAFNDEDWLGMDFADPVHTSSIRRRQF